MNSIDTVSELMQYEKQQTTGGETINLIDIIKPFFPPPRCPYYPPGTNGEPDPDGIYPFWG